MDDWGIPVLIPLTNTASKAAGIFLAICLLYHFIFRHGSPLLHLPAFGSVEDGSHIPSVVEGYQKCPDTPFTVPEARGESRTLVLPAKYINEIKSMPEAKISFVRSIYDRLFGIHSTLGVHDDTMVQSIKADLTRNIARTIECLQDEANFALPTVIGPCETWTPVMIYPRVLRIVALLSGRVFVGLPLCRNEQWIETTISYTRDAFTVAATVKKLSPISRYFFASSLPEVQRIKEHRTNGAKLLKPLLDERLTAMSNPKSVSPNDMIQFLLQNSPVEKKDDSLYQSYMQMLTSVAAIHTTAMNSTHVLYDLATHPEYIAPLRDEIEKVLADDGGILIKTSMTKLRKLDSFIKESQRLSPPSALSIMRKAMSDVTLSDGFKIPKGTYFAFPAYGINTNADLFPDPETFKGFRFSDLREQPGNENKFQFVTTGVDAISFGHGVHACPGRFFASNEIKVLIAEIILRYDVELLEGKKRPENLMRGTSIAVDPTGVLNFRDRKYGNVRQSQAVVV